MSDVLAIRHVAFEHVGSLEAVLGRRGHRIRYRDAAVDDLSSVDSGEPDLFIVLGGPLGAYEEERYLYGG